LQINKQFTHRAKMNVSMRKLFLPTTSRKNIDSIADFSFGEKTAFKYFDRISFSQSVCAVTMS